MLARYDNPLVDFGVTIGRHFFDPHLPWNGLYHLHLSAPTTDTETAWSVPGTAKSALSSNLCQEVISYESCNEAFDGVENSLPIRESMT